MIPAETLRELAYLRDRVAELEERERLLFGEREAAVKNIIKAWPKLTVSMARMLWAMARTRIVERDQILALVSLETDDIRAVDWRLKYVRKHIPGIDIGSVYGLGYELREPWAGRVKAIARGMQA